MERGSSSTIRTSKQEQFTFSVCETQEIKVF